MPVSTVGIYWPARAETAEACAARLGKCMRSIRQEFPDLADWHKLEQVSRQPISYDQDADLLKLLLKGRNKRDIGGEVMEELGFRVNLWNGRGSSEAMSLGVGCGMFSKVAGLSNAMYLTLPKNREALSLETDNALRNLLLVMVEAWSPDWGAVFDAKGEAIKDRQGNGPIMDNMLWLKNGLSLLAIERAHSKDVAFDGILYAT